MGNNPFLFWCFGCVSVMSKRADGYIVIGDVGNDEYPRLELCAVTADGRRPLQEYVRFNDNWLTTVESSEKDSKFSS
ncbi:hypothetical protein BGZ82_007975 [Podila clonocystis]|nr:hypothetical protein BGZ82_007975 [Podila clonocystis]